MAIVPFLPPEIPWLFDAVCGQQWPAGDEDALHRCAQAWADAYQGVADLAGNGDGASLGVLSNVASMSAEEFASFWSQYTGGDSALVNLAAQCQHMTAALDGQGNEVEYTKLSIDVTILLLAIQILLAIAASVFSLGGSLLEIPLATFFARESVLMLVTRLVQMVLTMMIPDLVSQTWMLVAGDEKSWDTGKTLAAGENAIAAGVIGTFLGGAAAKLPFMGEDFGKTLGGKVIQGIGHFAEGGTVMDLATVTTAGVNYAWAYARHDTDAMQAIQQQLTAANLWHQFVTGGMLATAFYLPHLAAPHGSPLSFAGADGKRYQVLLNDKTFQQFQADGRIPDGFTAPVYGEDGLKKGTATFNGPQVSFTREVGGSLSVDLGPAGSAGGFSVTHNGTTGRYGFTSTESGNKPLTDGITGGDAQPRPQLLSYIRPSDGTVTIDTKPTPGSPATTEGTMTVPKGSMVYYTPDGTVFRADLVDPHSTTVTVVQTASPGEPMRITGHTVYENGPGNVGKFLGAQGATLTGPDGRVIGHTSALTGRATMVDESSPAYRLAFGDHYNPLASTTTASAHGPAAAFESAPTTTPSSADAVPDNGYGGHDSSNGSGYDNGAAQQQSAAGPPSSSPLHDPEQAVTVIVDANPVLASVQEAAAATEIPDPANINSALPQHAVDYPVDLVVRDAGGPPASLPGDNSAAGAAGGAPLAFPDRIGPAELARRMPEFLDVQRRAEADVALLEDTAGRVGAELDQAMADARGGVTGADARAVVLRQELGQLEQRTQLLRHDLTEFSRRLWDARGRMGLRPAALGDRVPVDPELLHRRNVQRLFAKGRDLAGPGWAGEPPVVPAEDLLRDAQVLARVEVPTMERVKRLVSLHGALEQAVREGRVTPLLPDRLQRQLAGFRGTPAPRDGNPALLADRIAALRDRVTQLPDYQRLDAPLRAYVDRLVDEIQGEAELLPPGPAQGSLTPAGPDHAAGTTWLEHARQLASHPLNAMTQNVKGRLAYEVLRTPDGGIYLRFSKLIDVYSIEENQFGATRVTMVDWKLLELPLAHAGPVDLGIVAGLSTKYALSLGTEFRQHLDRGGAIAIKVAGPGERVIVSSWDRMPVDNQGQPMITTDLRPLVKHTLRTDLGVNPAVFLPGVKPVELPAEVKLSLEIVGTPRPGGGMEWKVHGTAELVLQSPDPRKAGISAAMDWLKDLGYPSWGPSPESSSEAAFVLGPVDFVKLPAGVRRQIENHLASRGVTITEEGAIPEDQVGQLAGDPGQNPLPEPAAADPASAVPLGASPIISALNPLPPAPSAAPRPLSDVLGIDPRGSVDEQGVLPYGPAPSPEDRLVLPFGPLPADPRLLATDPAPEPEERRVLQIPPATDPRLLKVTPPEEHPDNGRTLSHRGNDGSVQQGHAAEPAQQPAFPADGHPALPANLVPVPPPAGLEDLAGRVFRSRSGVVLYDGSDYRMLQAASQVRGDGVSFIADLHGIEGSPRAGGRKLTPEELLQLLQDAGWKGQRILLLSCRAGGEESFAVRLAALPELRDRGIAVIAAGPDEAVWQVSTSPNLFVAPGIRDENGTLQPAFWSDERRKLMPALWSAERQAFVPAVWSDKQDKFVPGEPQPFSWLSHRVEGGTPVVRNIPAGEHGMPAAAMDSIAGHPVATVAGAHPDGDGSRLDLAGHGSPHSPPAAAHGDLTDRGWLFGRPPPPAPNATAGYLARFQLPDVNSSELSIRKGAAISRLSDQQLLDSIFRPRDGVFITVEEYRGYLVVKEGNHRVHELQARIWRFEQGQGGAITRDTPVFLKWAGRDHSTEDPGQQPPAQPDDLVSRGDAGPPDSPVQSELGLSPRRVNEILAELDAQVQQDQHAYQQLHVKRADISSALEQHTEESLALADKQREVGQELAALDVAAAHRDEYAALLTALQDAQTRHADASQRLSAAKSEPADHGSAAAYEMLTRQETRALQRAVAAWQESHGLAPANVTPLRLIPGMDPARAPGATVTKVWESPTFSTSRRWPTRVDRPLLGGREISFDRKTVMERVELPDGSAFLVIAVESEKRTVTDGGIQFSDVLVTPQAAPTALHTTPIGNPVPLQDIRIGNVHVPASELHADFSVAYGTEMTGMRQVTVSTETELAGSRAALVIRLAGPGNEWRTGLLGAGTRPVWFAARDGSPGEPETEQQTAYAGEAYLLVAAFASIFDGAAGAYVYAEPLKFEFEARRDGVTVDVGFELGASLAVFPSLAQAWSGASLAVGMTADGLLRALGVPDPQVSAALQHAVTEIDGMLRAHGLDLTSLFNDWLNFIAEPVNVSASLTVPLDKGFQNFLRVLDGALEAAALTQGGYAPRVASDLFYSFLARLPRAQAGPAEAAGPAADEQPPPPPPGPRPAERPAPPLPPIEVPPTLTPDQAEQARQELAVVTAPLPPDVEKALTGTGQVEGLLRFYDYQAAALQEWHEKWAAVISEQGRHARELIDQQRQAQVELINQRAYQQIGLTPVVPHGLEHLAGLVFRSEHGLVVQDGSDFRMLAAAVLLGGDGTSFVVDMHGSDGIPQAGNEGLKPEDFPKLLEAGGWNKQPIVLLACATGGTEGSFAAKVAALPELRGVEVFAADAEIWQLVGDGRLWLGRVWSDEHNMMLPAEPSGAGAALPPTVLSDAGSWWGHRYENGKVVPRRAGTTEDGMPVTEPAVANANTVPDDRNGQPGPAGSVSGHARPAAKPEDWILRGARPRQPDPVLADASAVLTAAADLGPVVASGGFGSLHEVPGYPNLLVKVAIGSAGGDNAQLLAEAANLERLAEIGVPTAYRGLLHWQRADGVPRTGILMDRVDPGALSKAVLATGKFAGTAPAPGQVALVNSRTVQDLQLIRDLCLLHAINIEDIQVMIAGDGSVRLIDPARMTDLGKTRHADRKQIMRQFERRIQHIIDAMRKIAARRGPA